MKNFLNLVYEKPTKDWWEIFDDDGRFSPVRISDNEARAIISATVKAEWAALPAYCQDDDDLSLRQTLRSTEIRQALMKAGVHDVKKQLKSSGRKWHYLIGF